MIRLGPGRTILFFIAVHIIDIPLGLCVNYNFAAGLNDANRAALSNQKLCMKAYATFCI